MQRVELFSVDTAAPHECFVLSDGTGRLIANDSSPTERVLGAERSRCLAAAYATLLGLLLLRLWLLPRRQLLRWRDNVHLVPVNPRYVLKVVADFTHVALAQRTFGLLLQPAQKAEVVEVSVGAWPGLTDLSDAIEADDAAFLVMVIGRGDLGQGVLENPGLGVFLCRVCPRVKLHLQGYAYA